MLGIYSDRKYCNTDFLFHTEIGMICQFEYHFCLDGISNALHHKYALNTL